MSIGKCQPEQFRLEKLEKIISSGKSFLVLMTLVYPFYASNVLDSYKDNIYKIEDKKSVGLKPIENLKILNTNKS
jgi:hypothetical protein